MVLTNAKNNAFFTDNIKMGLSTATINQLSVEGIQTVNDLHDFDKDSLEQVANNLRCPAAGAAAFAFGAKSHKRLLVATKLVKFYETVVHGLTAGNNVWNNVIKNFESQWEAIEKKKAKEELDVPIVSKDLPIIKRVEAFRNHLHRCISVRYAPLSYVVREDDAVQATVPALALNQPYSTEHGSIEDELVARADHNDGLFRDNNATVYFKLEEAMRGSQYAPSIKPFQKRRNGSNAFISLGNQFAGTDK